MSLLFILNKFYIHRFSISCVKFEQVNGGRGNVTRKNFGLKISGKKNGGKLYFLCIDSPNAVFLFFS